MAQEWNNFKMPGTGSNIYGEPRLELAKHLRDDVLEPNTWFIENGTLLGAYRNNKFIELDDDFDIGMLITNSSQINHIYNKIKSKLNPKYDCRIIDTYSNKIEVFDPSYGSYNLSEKYSHVTYHYVTVDIQFYLKIDDKNFKQMYHIDPIDIIVNIDLIYPLKSILLESEHFPCPSKTKEFLENTYGCIEDGAVYNKETGKYHKIIS